MLKLVLKTIIKRIALLIMVFPICTIVNAQEIIQPFTSDGCSAFPDGTLKQNKLWLSCCTTHDLAYWQGGTEAQRLAADKELKHCVTQVGEPTIAKLMLAGVRVGGTPYLPTKFRWGYGWSYPRGYGELTKVEKATVATAKSHIKQSLGVVVEENKLHKARKAQETPSNKSNVEQ